MSPHLTTLFVLALALSMDSFAAAMSKGAAARPRPGTGGALRIGAAFGVAQALMPLLGWALGLAFALALREVDHWVAFIVLGVLGGRMIRQGLANQDENVPAPLSAGWPLFGAAIATSIDAAAAGVTLAFLKQPILFACAVIGTVTLLISVAGVFLGAVAGSLIGRRAEILGGLVLIALGTKILVEHLWFNG
jgi:putative Mn2+ efflux pump MntP